MEPSTSGKQCYSLIAPAIIQPRLSTQTLLESMSSGCFWMSSSIKMIMHCLTPTYCSMGYCQTIHTARSQLWSVCQLLVWCQRHNWHLDGHSVSSSIGMCLPVPLWLQVPHERCGGCSRWHWLQSASHARHALHQWHQLWLCTQHNHSLPAQCHCRLQQLHHCFMLHFSARRVLPLLQHNTTLTCTTTIPLHLGGPEHPQERSLAVICKNLFFYYFYTVKNNLMMPGWPDILSKIVSAKFWLKQPWLKIFWLFQPNLAETAIFEWITTVLP